MTMIVASVGETAIAGGAAIVGAIAGGVTAAYAALKLDRERQRREGEGAWRLLRAELGDALDAIYTLRKGDSWPIGWHKEWSAAWQEGRRPLLLRPPARTSDEDVATVVHACLKLDQLENAVNERRPDSERPFKGRDLHFLGRLQRDDFEPACRVLGYNTKIADPPPPPGDSELQSWASLGDEVVAGATGAQHAE